MKQFFYFTFVLIIIPQIFSLQINMRASTSKNFLLDSSTSQKPVITHREDAKYPKSEMDEGRHGFVVVSVILLSNGTMREVAPIVELSSELNRSAIDASYQIHFRPALKNGSPVSIRSALEFSFQYEYVDEQRLKQGIQFSFPYLSSDNLKRFVQVLNLKKTDSLAADIEVLVCEERGIAKLSEEERGEYETLQREAKKSFPQKKLDIIFSRLSKMDYSDLILENTLIVKGIALLSEKNQLRYIKLHNQAISFGLKN
jgi:TonB family protein